MFAEREFIAGQAQSHPVRRGAETIAHRTLGQVVEDRLASRRVDADTVVWDAWKIEARRWLVRVDYDSGKSHREARFIYDASGRFSTADNDDARWLLGLHSASHGPQPGRRRRDEEAEPTVELNDELALVRVVQPRADEPADPDDTVPLEELTTRSTTPTPRASSPRWTASTTSSPRPIPASTCSTTCSPASTRTRCRSTPG